jgi:hypothetical protein
VLGAGAGGPPQAGRNARFSTYYQRPRERLEAIVALAPKLAGISFYRGRAAESSGVHLRWRMVGASTQTV